jgi:ATP-dependent exoDNAse (exonuclease V) beta subunit
MRVFTEEQRAAIAARTGSQLLSANAGSGKTAVMVERFVEAVLSDGVGVGAILALTFTEKAAGELRDRLRRRLLELGEIEHAREADGAWVGTIHGFCARVLRAEPLAAGLDPRFSVLDEATSQRLAGQAWEEALEDWARTHGESALALAGAYGMGLQPLVIDTHAALRSAGQTVPRLPCPAPASARPDCSELARARALAFEALESAASGKRIERAREVLTACQELLSGCGPEHPVPVPGALDPARLAGGYGALAGEECDGYRDAFGRYAQACADHHARDALALIDDLLGRYDAAYAAAKRRRGSVDFADLELFTRDLLAASPSRRARWSDRFELLMVDEFQDTNRVQLDILEFLERDNMFAVGDELQSIYGFRHADVTIFRERRAALPAERIRRLTANFRSREPVLDVLNGVFAPVFGERFSPLRAGRRDGGEPTPAVELLLTDARGWEGHEGELGLTDVADQAWRRAEARRLAERIAQELAAGRRPGEVVVLVRSTASLRLFEQALEERGVATYVLGGRGYWSQEQVRDGLAYLAALANPLDELALLGALASPFCGVGSDALITLAETGRRNGAGLWAALESARAGEGMEHLDVVEAERLRRFAGLLADERDRAERDSPEVLLERAVLATGYDLAILGRAGGDRRMANLRKLMRLAREYDAAEGHDLRGFIAYATGQDLREAREGEAPLEAEDLDAVRLMTIHRAKGLEFPVVAVADLGRQGGSGRSPLLVSRDGRVGLRLATLGGGARVDALDYRTLADEQAAAEDEEERRLLYVAMTRAEELLIVSGGVDPERLPSARPGGAPIAWLLPALLDRPADVLADPRAHEPGGLEVRREWDGRPARTRVLVDTVGGALLPELRGAAARAAATRPPAPAEEGPSTPVRPFEESAITPPATASNHSSPAPVAPDVEPGEAPVAPPPLAPVGRTTPVRLSYTSLQDYARCPYRFYLQRRLRLPSEPAEEGVAGEQLRLSPAPPAVSARVRGVVAHRLLEELDFAAPSTPGPARVSRLLRDEGVGAHTRADVEDLRAMVARFASSALCRRLAEAVAIRREAPFAFAVRPGVEPLLGGALDVHAVERDGGVLVIDFKSDRLGGRRPSDVVDSGYAIQRAVYALAVLASGAECVEVAYCFLERPDDVVGTCFTRADAPSLSDAVLAAADGVLAGHWPVAASPHRELCGDCPGRRVLCSHTEDLTLRDPREAQDDPFVPDRATTGASEPVGVSPGESGPGCARAAVSVSGASASPAGACSSVSSSGAAADTEP